MALPAPPPARVFAELVPGQAPIPTPTPAGLGSPPAPSGREVHVSGSAELSAGPDRARVSLRLGSRKGAAGAARSSVARRLEYIAQSVRQRGVPEENMTVTEDFSRLENTYQMEAEISFYLHYFSSLNWRQRKAEDKSGWGTTVAQQQWHGSPNLDLLKPQVCIVFSDFGKMQNVCNLLVEKLGTSVTICPPHFYHTPEAVDTLRRQVCVAAVGNTHRKAQEVCRLFGQSLGKPLLIREEETKEWGGHIDSHLSNSLDSLTLQERIQHATAYASCRVFAVFEIRGKENKRSKLL